MGVYDWFLDDSDSEVGGPRGGIGGTGRRAPVLYALTTIDTVGRKNFFDEFFF